MKGLYTKVLSGRYDSIPRVFSPDLTKMIGKLLKVNPKMRPDCDQILNDNIVKKYILKD